MALALKVLKTVTLRVLLLLLAIHTSKVLFELPESQEAPVSDTISRFGPLRGSTARPLIWRRHHFTSTTQWLAATLLFLSGDIHTNPGPPKQPCGTCSRAVCWNQKGILCEACYQWFHAKCVDLSDTEYRYLSSVDEGWCCKKCLTTALPYYDSSTIFLGSSLYSNSGTVTDSSTSTLSLQANQLRLNGNSSISLLCTNVRSLLPKMDEMRAHCLAMCTDRVCVTETWLCPDIANSEVYIPGYSVFRMDRNHRGDGVAIYIRYPLSASVHPIYIMSSGLISTEFLLLRLSTMQQRLVVGVFYRPPSTDTQYFINFQDTLKHLHPCDFQNLLICGDYNINVSDSASPTSFHPLLEQLCLEFSLSQIVSNPTRISAGHSSILDLVLLSNPQSLLSCTITEPIATSDHLSVSVQLSSSNRPPKMKPTRRKVWIYKAVNTELASDLFGSFDASLLKQNCVNESWSVWKSKFWSVIHATIPSKSVPTHRNLPWLSREIFRAIRKHSYLFRKSKRSRNPNHLQRYHS